VWCQLEGVKVSPTQWIEEVRGGGEEGGGEDEEDEEDEEDFVKVSAGTEVDDSGLTSLTV